MLKFSPVYSFTNYVQKTLFLDMAKQKLLKNIHMHNFNLLNFVHIVVFDVETALKNAKTVVLVLDLVSDF